MRESKPTTIQVFTKAAFLRTLSALRSSATCAVILCCVVPGGWVCDVMGLRGVVWQGAVRPGA